MELLKTRGGWTEFDSAMLEDIDIDADVVYCDDDGRVEENYRVFALHMQLL